MKKNNHQYFIATKTNKAVWLETCTKKALVDICLDILRNEQLDDNEYIQVYYKNDKKVIYNSTNCNTFHNDELVSHEPCNESVKFHKSNIISIVYCNSANVMVYGSYMISSKGNVIASNKGTHIHSDIIQLDSLKSCFDYVYTIEEYTKQLDVIYSAESLNQNFYKSVDEIELQYCSMVSTALNDGRISKKVWYETRQAIYNLSADYKKRAAEEREAIRKAEETAEETTESAEETTEKTNIETNTTTEKEKNTMQTIRTFRTKDTKCIITIEVETRRNLLDFLIQYLENREFEWFVDTVDTFKILYKDGSSDYISSEYDGHHIKMINIKSIVWDNGETYVVYGNFSINDYGVVDVADGIQIDSNIEEVIDTPIIDEHDEVYVPSKDILRILIKSNTVVSLKNELSKVNKDHFISIFQKYESDTKAALATGFIYEDEYIKIMEDINTVRCIYDPTYNIFQAKHGLLELLEMNCYDSNFEELCDVLFERHKSNIITSRISEIITVEEQKALSAELAVMVCKYKEAADELRHIHRAYIFCKKRNPPKVKSAHFNPTADIATDSETDILIQKYRDKLENFHKNGFDVVNVHTKFVTFINLKEMYGEITSTVRDALFELSSDILEPYLNN